MDKRKFPSGRVSSVCLRHRHLPITAAQDAGGARRENREPIQCSGAEPVELTLSAVRRHDEDRLGITSRERTLCVCEGSIEEVPPMVTAITCNGLLVPLRRDERARREDWLQTS